MKNPSTFRRLLRYLRHSRILLFLSLMFTLATVFSALYLPVLFGDVIDVIVGKDQVDFDVIRTLSVRILILIGCTALLQWLINICNNRMAFSIIYEMRRDAFSKLQKLPLSYLDNHPTGETVSRIVSDTEQLTDGLLLGFTQFFSGILTILGTLAFMFRIRWQIALLVVLITPLSLFVASFIARHSYHLFHAQAKIRAEQTALVDELIGQHKVVTAFSHEQTSLADFDRVNEELRTTSRRALFFSSLTNPSTRFVNNLVYAGVALTGALICIAAEGTGSGMSVGSLFSLLTYATQYTKPFNEISGVIAEMQNALACARRVFDLLDAEEEPEDPADAHTLTKEEIDGRIDIDDVSFSYTPDRPLIEHFRLSLQNGQRVAIVGPTGCGKTTMINLIMRFYDCDEGEIRISGYPTKSLTRASLRRNVGMVLQDTWLKQASVYDNIAMSKPGATKEEVEQAAMAAHAHNFIRRLPQGYDTILGEGGGSLSQGQKQLLCIARVMLALPPVLILDEATSSIDTRTELKIQNAFSSMMRGRTSIVIAHRLSTIREADIILVMKDGKVVERGNHKTLLEKGGYYAELYNSQFDATESSAEKP